MQSELNQLGIQSYDSVANFLLLRLPCEVNSDRFWRRMILDHHIVLRNCHNFEGLGSGYVRAAVRTEFQNEVLVKAVGRALPECQRSLQA